MVCITINLQEGVCIVCVTINVEQKLYISTTSFNFEGPIYEGASLRGCIVGTNHSIHYNESPIQKIDYDRLLRVLFIGLVLLLDLTW